MTIFKTVYVYDIFFDHHLRTNILVDNQRCRSSSCVDVCVCVCVCVCACVCGGGGEGADL